MPVKHTKVSSVADGADANLVRPSDWNADHSIVGTTTVTDGSFVLNATAQPETVGPEVHWYGRSGRWIVGVDVANALKSRDFVLAGRQFSYSFDDGVTTSGSATLTSASQGGFAASMVGAGIAGAGIPAGATVTAVASATSLTMSAAATASATAVRVTVTQTGVHDEVYLKHRGRLATTIGLGVTPPTGDYRVQIAASDSEAALGTLGVRIGPSQTGHPFAVYDSNGPVSGLRQWLTKDAYWKGKDAGLVVEATNDANDRSVVMRDDAGYTYGFTHPTGSGNEMRIRYITGGVDILRFKTDGAFIHQSTKLGFYGATAVTKPALTYSRSGETTAQAQIRTALSSLGLVTDSTTA